MLFVPRPKPRPSMTEDCIQPQTLKYSLLALVKSPLQLLIVQMDTIRRLMLNYLQPGHRGHGHRPQLIPSVVIVDLNFRGSHDNNVLRYCL